MLELRLLLAGAAELAVEDVARSVSVSCLPSNAGEHIALGTQGAEAAEAAEPAVAEAGDARSRSGEEQDKTRGQERTETAKRLRAWSILTKKVSRFIERPLPRGKLGTARATADPDLLAFPIASWVAPSVA
jgi:hypothetical protein